MQDSAPIQITDFRIERQIGAGGMGIVYLARQVSLDRLFALKCLRRNHATGTDGSSADQENLSRSLSRRDPERRNSVQRGAVKGAEVELRDDRRNPKQDNQNPAKRGAKKK